MNMPEVFKPAFPIESLQEAHKQVTNQWLESIDLMMGSMDTFNVLTKDAISNMQQAPMQALNAWNWSTLTESQKAAPTPSIQKTGFVAVVTGGIGGLGTEICKKLYTDGHEVIATFIKMEAEKAVSWQKELKAEGFDISIKECDVTQYRTCQKVAKELIKDFGHVDILVNCAGITRDAVLKKMDKDKWDAVLRTNLDSAFYVTKAFIENMYKLNYGRIINISSVNGQKGQFGQTNYASAKAGMIGFSRALARETAESGITVNTICPGYVGTAMVEAIDENIKQKIIDTIPMKRLAKPSEIAQAVAFLASEDCAYMTGSELSINGGLFMSSF